MTRGAFLLVLAVGLGSVGRLGGVEEPADPFAEGTEWKGKLTQKGNGPGGGEDLVDYDAVLAVTRRRGKVFEAELREKSETRAVTYLVSGTVAPGKAEGSFKVDFESFADKDVGEGTVAYTKIPYTATLKGKGLKGTWKYPKNDQDITLEGGFNLKLAK